MIFVRFGKDECGYTRVGKQSPVEKKMERKGRNVLKSRIFALAIPVVLVMDEKFLS